jgi:hypothetical protein
MKGEKHKTRVVEEASPLSSPRVLHAVRHDAVEPLGERVNLPARPPVPDVVPSVHRGVERVQLKNLESKRCVGAGIFYFIDSRGLSHQTTVGAFTSYGGSNATAVQLPPPPCRDARGLEVGVHVLEAAAVLVDAVRPNQDSVGGAVGEPRLVVLVCEGG